MEECPICCESFTKTLRAKVTCINHECNLVVCRSCFKNNLEKNVTSEPLCMGCKSVIPMEKIADGAGSTFIKGAYRNVRKNYLLERAVSQFPETMAAVERIKEAEKAEEKLKEIKLKLYDLKNEKNKLERHIWRLKNNSVTEEKRKFIMACPVENCRGFLSSQYKCGLCESHTCSKCFAVLGLDRNVQHTCKQEDLATAEMIRSQTKPCPSCGERIEKQSGCDQMWCTQCRTPFSWRTGAIERGHIHNPHFYEFARQNQNAAREAGDVPCGGIPNCMSKLYRTRFHKMPDGRRLETYLRNIIHVVGEVRRRTQEKIRALEDTEALRVKYLLGQITREQLASKLAQRDHERQFLIERGQIYELIANLGVERMRAIDEDIEEYNRNKEGRLPCYDDEEFHLVPKLLPHLKEIIAIDKYVIEQTTRISKTYKLKANAPGIIHFGN